MLLKIEHLKKSFKENHVLKDVSFDIEEGKLIALLGKNGAGKTTLIKCILGLEAATSGKIDRNINLKRDIGFMPQDDIIPSSFSVLNFLNLQKKIYNSKIDLNKELEKIGLSNHKKSKVNSLSGGQKRKLSFLNAIIHKPKLLILDEPTTGLDLDGVEVFWEYIAKLQKEKTSIILITHDFDQIQSYADEVIFLKNGKNKFNIQTKEMLDQNVYELNITNLNGMPEKTSTIFDVLSTNESINFYYNSYRNLVIVEDTSIDSTIKLLKSNSLNVAKQKRRMTVKDTYKFIEGDDNVDDMHTI